MTNHNAPQFGREETPNDLTNISIRSLLGALSIKQLWGLIVFVAGILISIFSLGFKVSSLFDNNGNAPDQKPAQEQVQEIKQEQVWLRISKVSILQRSGGASEERLDSVRVIALVNGIALSYPSRTIWSRVDPEMKEEEFPLPMDSSDFRISFSMFVQNRGDVRKFTSQEVVTANSIPFEGQYQLHEVKKSMHGDTREAIVDFELLTH